MFTQRLWMIPVAHWVGISGLAYGLYVGSPAWYALLLFFALANSLAVTVGLHRYFTHGAFTTNRFWHTVMAVYANITVQGSALGWGAAHQTHHTHSDSAGDPHHTGIDYLWNKKYRNVPMELWRVKHLVKDPVIAWAHRYAVLVIAGWVLLLAGAGLLTGTGLKPLVFCYLAPLGVVHTFGALHQVLSHRGGAPRDMPWMEWITPACGEWQHKFHHENPRAWKIGRKWYHLDLGAAFIYCIKSR